MYFLLFFRELSNQVDFARSKFILALENILSNVEIFALDIVSDSNFISSVIFNFSKDEKGLINQNIEDIFKISLNQLKNNIKSFSLSLFGFYNFLNMLLIFILISDNLILEDILTSSFAIIIDKKQLINIDLVFSGY